LPLNHLRIEKIESKQMLMSELARKKRNTQMGLYEAQRLLVTIVHKIKDDTRYDHLHLYFVELDAAIDAVLDPHLASLYDRLSLEMNKADYFVADVRPLLLELLLRIDSLLLETKKDTRNHVSSFFF